MDTHLDTHQYYKTMAVDQDELHQKIMDGISGRQVLKKRGNP